MAKKSDDRSPRTFRMRNSVYKVLVDIAEKENRRVGNQLEELILRNKVGGDDRVPEK